MSIVRVQVRLYAGLRRYRPELGHGEGTEIELGPGSRLRDALEALDIPEHETKQCFVNGVVQDSDHVLEDGDEMGVFPPIAGGGDAA